MWRELPVFFKRESFGKFRCCLNMLLNISQISIDMRYGSWDKMFHKFGGIWSKLPICPIGVFWEKWLLLFVYRLYLIMLINILKRLLKLVSTIFFCQIFLFSLNDSPSKIIKNIFLFNCKNSFCSWDIQISGNFSRVASNFWNENSRTFPEHINTFQEHERSWKYHNNWFAGFFKKLNLITTKDKSHEIQISTRTKLRKS